ncbi:alpha/beta fold hydrolase [Aquirhabdus sp.]|uniref:alpha/beta fold hydrolase n=1 Tax=Aquirhabdus sp. TaxID=2824160 RepID=UPI00396C5C35
MNRPNLDLNIQVTGIGTPFIWAHGLLMSMAVEDQIDWFEWSSFPKNIQLIRYDARGHGASRSSLRAQDYHWDQLGRDMLSVASLTHHEQFIAAGDSMGCATALYAAIQAPERIKALLLVIPPTAWQSRITQKRLYRGLAVAGGLLGGSRLSSLTSSNMERMLPPWLVTAEKEKLHALSEGLATRSRLTLWNLMRGVAVSDLPTREQLTALKDIPIAIIGWTDDRSHPTATAETLHAWLPQSSLYIARNYQDFKTIPKRMQDFIARFT